MEFSERDLFSLPELDRQDELISLAAQKRTIASTVAKPVAHVRLEMSHIHMDRVFDYEIPEKFADVPVGARVVVDVAARQIDAFVVGRSDTTTVGSALRPIKRVVSNVPVLTPNTEALCLRVARRQAAPTADALRLAIPQRHARAEKEFFELPPVELPEWQSPTDLGAWADHAAGAALISRISAGQPVRAVVQESATRKASEYLVPLVQAQLAAAKGVLVVVPTPVRVADLARELSEALPGEPIDTLVSDDDPATRYSKFLGALTGRARVIVGTRSAGWAPIQNLGLVVLIDDHHTALAEPRSPYIHARELLVERATFENTAFVSLNAGPSVELAELVSSGWAAMVEPTQSRAEVPQVLASNQFRFEGAPWSRMPESVFAVVRDGLKAGSVLMLVPRSGYIPALACETCREFATCTKCGGALSIPAPDAPPTCSRCAAVHRDYRCQKCSSTKLKAIRIGSQRTAQEIGRAFQGVKLHLADVAGETALDPGRRIVIATPGLVPEVEGGYAAAVVLDAGYLLRSSALDSEVYFLRALAAVTSHVRPRSKGGKVLIVGDIPPELIDAARLWEMGPWAQAQLEDRAMLSLPPSAVWVELSGAREDVRLMLAHVRTAALDAGMTVEDVPLDALLSGGVHDLIPGMVVLGPQEAAKGGIAVYLRFDQSEREDRTALIERAAREYSVRHAGGAVRIVVDPQL